MAWHILKPIGLWILHQSLNWAFNYIDKDNDGTISKKELMELRGHLDELRRKIKTKQ